MSSQIGGNSKINGIPFLAGNELNINSNQEYIFGLGKEVRINSDILKDTFLAGEKITLEDIEEELGIDLVTLFKALKNGIYGTSYGTSKEEKHFVSYYKLSDIDIKKYDGKIAFIYHLGNLSYSDFIVYKLEDYGKTWALTKEELK